MYKVKSENNLFLTKPTKNQRLLTNLLNNKYIYNFSFVETCHVPHAEIILNYVPFPPYIYAPKVGTRPTGIMLDLAEHSFLFCAKQCISFAHNVSFTYKQIDVEYFINSTNLSYNTSELLIPRIDSGGLTITTNIITIKSPGFLLLKAPDKPVILAAKQEIVLMDAIASVVPLCMLYFVINWAFGAIFWFCVSFTVLLFMCL